VASEDAIAVHDAIGRGDIWIQEFNCVRKVSKADCAAHYIILSVIGS
jgi:hypothetical protein